MKRRPGNQHVRTTMSSECGIPGRSRCSTKLELLKTIPCFYSRGKLLPVRHLYFTQMHHPQSKAILNRFVKQFPQLHPGPIYSNSYGKREENGTCQSTYGPTISLLNILIQQGLRGASRSDFSIMGLASSPRQARRTARRRTCPKLLSGPLSFRESPYGRNSRRNTSSG